VGAPVVSGSSVDGLLFLCAPLFAAISACLNYSAFHLYSKHTPVHHTHCLPSHTHLQHIALLQKHTWVDPESSSWALCDKWASVGIAAVVVVRGNKASSMGTQKTCSYTVYGLNLASKTQTLALFFFFLPNNTQTRVDTQWQGMDYTANMQHTKALQMGYTSFHCAELHDTPPPQAQLI